MANAAEVPRQKTILTASGEKKETVKLVPDVDPTGERHQARSILVRISSDPVYRTNFIATIWLGVAFATLGWVSAQKGPCLLDFILITESNLEQGSAFFTAGTVGNIVGSIIYGVFLERFSRKLILSIAFCILGIVSAIIPWCSSYWLMVICNFAVGMGTITIAAGGNAECMRIWGKEGAPYIQFINFIYAVGAILSPLATKSFLASKTFDQANVTEYSKGPITNSAIYATEKTDEVIRTSFVHKQGVASNIIASKESLLYIPFSMTAVLSFLSALPFFVYFFCRVEKQQHVTDNIREPREVLPLTLKAVVLFLLGLFTLLYTSVEDTGTGLLMTFVVKEVGWTKQKGSDLMSLFWAFFAIGRFLGIFATKYFHSCKIIASCCFSIFLSFLGLYLCVICSEDAIIWVFTSMAGLSMSCVFPCIFSWAEADIISISGRVSSFLFLISSGGVSVSFLALGYLMQHHGYIYYLYFHIAENVMTLIALALLFVIVKYKLPNTKSSVINSDSE